MKKRQPGRLAFFYVLIGLTQQLTKKSNPPNLLDTKFAILVSTKR